MRRGPPGLWGGTVSVSGGIRAGVGGVWGLDKGPGGVQVTWAVTQISFNRSVAVPVHSLVDSTRNLIAGKRGSAWAEDSYIVGRRSWFVVRGSLTLERCDERAV